MKIGHNQSIFMTRKLARNLDVLKMKIHDIRGEFTFSKKEKWKVLYSGMFIAFLCFIFWAGQMYVSENNSWLYLSLTPLLLLSLLIAFYAYLKPREKIIFSDNGVSIDVNDKTNWACSWNEISKIHIEMKTKHEVLLMQIETSKKKKQIPVCDRLSAEIEKVLEQVRSCD